MNPPCQSIEMEEHEPCFRHMCIGDELGRGAFGKVYLTAHNAIKIYEHDVFALDVLREIIILRAIHHPNIIQVYTLSGGVMAPVLHMEIFGFNLNIIRKSFRYKQRLSMLHSLLEQTLSALAYLHSRNILHLDIKPDNILVQPKGYEFEVKLCDFGTAMIMPCDETNIHFGTEGYRAPELHKLTFTFAPPVDIWALGCTIYEFIMEHKPNMDNYLHIVDDLETDQIIVRMLAPNVSDRMMARDIVKSHESKWDPLALSFHQPALSPYHTELLKKMFSDPNTLEPTYNDLAAFWAELAYYDFRMFDSGPIVLF
jgi:serine/threonine protein kinase